MSCLTSSSGAKNMQGGFQRRWCLNWDFWGWEGGYTESESEGPWGMAKFCILGKASSSVALEV